MHRVMTLMISVSKVMKQVIEFFMFGNKGQISYMAASGVQFSCSLVTQMGAILSDKYLNSQFAERMIYAEYYTLNGIK